MAVSNVSTVDNDTWQLISTTTLGTQASLTFSSLSGYKHYMIAGKGITKSVSDYPGIVVNNDQTTIAYATLWGGGSQDKFLINAATQYPSAFLFRIYDCDQAIPHRVDCAYDGASASGQPNDAYTNPVVITSLKLLLHNGNNFTGGTVYLYGIAS